MRPTPPPTPSPGPRALRSQAVEAITRGLGVEAGSEAHQEMVRLCGGTDRVPPDVPVERFVAVLDALGRRRFPDASRAEALYRLGAATFEGYRLTLLGRVQLAALALMGPERLTRTTPDIFGRNSNFGRRWVDPLGPAHYVLHFRGVPIPAEYYRGIFETGLRAAGAPAARVTPTQTGEDIDFDVTW